MGHQKLSDFGLTGRPRKRSRARQLLLAIFIILSVLGLAGGLAAVVAVKVALAAFGAIAAGIGEFLWWASALALLVLYLPLINELLLLLSTGQWVAVILRLLQLLGTS
jgi:hypothetical protein